MSVSYKHIAALWWGR